MLVVNDDRTQLLRISRVLEKQNLEVLRFENGADAVAYLDQGERADLLITDLHMPHVDGWKLCRLIRSREYEEYNDIPILATSAVFCGEEAQSLTASLGANALLRAPFTSAELIRCTRELLTGEIPSIRTKLLMLPSPKKPFRGLASCFKRFGYEVLEEPNAKLALKHLEVWKPAVVIVWHGHGEEVLDGVLNRERTEATFTANLVILDDDWEGHQVELLKAGADACVWSQVEPDYVVSLTEKMSRVRALLRLQDQLELQSEDLRAQRESFRGLLEGIPDPAALYDSNGAVQMLNETCANLLCTNAAKVIGRKVTDFLVAEELQESMESGWGEVMVASYPASLVTYSGNSFEVDVHQSPLKFNHDWATLVVLTEKEQFRDTYEPIRSSDTSFPMLTENAYDWEFWRSPQGHFLYSSPICKKITGYEPFEFEMDINFLNRVAHPEDVHLVPQPDEEMSDDILEAEFRIVDKAGNVRWLAYKSRPVYDDNGNYLGCRGAMRDLTLHKELENEKERLVAAVEQFSDSMAITNLDGKLEYINPAFERNMGISNREALGTVYDMVDVAPVQEAISAGAVWSGRRNRTIQPIGEQRVVEITMSPVRDASGQLRNLVWVERDVTAEVELQERLMQAQRMEAIGTLAGGVAHDFNNLLSGILGYSSLLKGEPSSWSDIQQAATVIERAAKRAADLTQKLLGFARQGKHKHESFSIHDSIAEVLTLLTRTTDPKVTIEGVLDAENPWIRGDSGQLGQVLLNLAINSTHAIKNSGRLTIYTRNVPFNELPIFEETFPRAEEYIEVKVEDTGCGIPDDKLSRIFEPFFTTKEKGSGLGLAMVYGIVQNHDGAIKVDSTVGEGTTFTLYLPTSTYQEPAQKPPAPITQVRQGKGTILVIDDEEIVRNIAAKMLTRIGYEVITIADGHEAVDFYSKNQEKVDLVIVDMMMPRMDGRECFSALRQINPNVRAILSTGYSHNQAVQEVIDEGLLGYIGKPFDLQEIATAVENAIQKNHEETEVC